MQFWITACLLSLGIAGVLCLRLMRRGALSDEPAGKAPDIAVYRQQLQDVDRDIARGTLTEDEGARLRVEVSRRLLDADKAAQTRDDAPADPDQAGSMVGVFAVAAAVVGGIALYAVLGAPAYPDMPLAKRLSDAEEIRATRPSQAEAEALVPAQPQPEADPRLTELMTELRAAMEENPDDTRGLELLATYEARLGNFAAATQAQEHLIAVKGEAATADDHANAAELLVLAAGGYVSPEAEEHLKAALTRDPNNGIAHFYYGQSYAQTGRPDLAFGIWQRLLRNSRPDAPWVPAVMQQMPELAQLAGVRWTPPELRGPTQEDIDAASDLSDEDRQAMIRGMVDSLSSRLANDGGPPEDWARLISSLGVLGDRDEASAIWTEAQTVFAGAPEALDLIRSAAVAAGVAR